MNATTNIDALGTRIQALESSLRRSHLLVALLILLVAGAAMTPQAQEQAQDQVTTRRLVLTNGATEPSAVVLLAGPESSLIIQTPAGAEVLRLGGPAARRIIP